MLPVSLPWLRRRLEVSAELERQLRTISPRQIDRRLQPRKRILRRRLYGRTKPGTLLKHHIPIKTDHWNVTRPGFTEIDLVAVNRGRQRSPTRSPEPPLVRSIRRSRSHLHQVTEGSNPFGLPPPA